MYEHSALSQSTLIRFDGFLFSFFLFGLVKPQQSNNEWMRLFFHFSCLFFCGRFETEEEKMCVRRINIGVNECASRRDQLDSVPLYPAADSLSCGPSSPLEFHLSLSLSSKAWRCAWSCGSFFLSFLLLLLLYLETQQSFRLRKDVVP